MNKHGYHYVFFSNFSVTAAFIVTKKQKSELARHLCSLFSLQLTELYSIWEQIVGESVGLKKMN
jgi:hypothetical protein